MLCQKVEWGNLSFFSITADFYRQNWPFLLLDTGLNVALGKQNCPRDLPKYILGLVGGVRFGGMTLWVRCWFVVWNLA